jgi:hypothetical protein
VRGTRDHNSLILPEGGLPALIHQLATADPTPGSGPIRAGHAQAAASPAGATEPAPVVLEGPHRATSRRPVRVRTLHPTNTVYARKFSHPKVGVQKVHPNRVNICAFDAGTWRQRGTVRP